MRDAVTAFAPATGGVVVAWRGALAADDRGAYATGAGATRGGDAGSGGASVPGGVPAPGGASVAGRGVRGGTVGELAAVVDRLGALLDIPAGELEERDADELRSRVQVLRRVEGMAAAALAATVGALARSGAIRADGASSTTAWVAEQTGTSKRDAARRARLATDLDGMSATRDALASGTIGVEAADAVVRAARDGRLGTPEQVEAVLLPVARAETPERLRSHVRRLTQQADGTAMLHDERTQHARRRFTLTERDDGMWQPDGQLTAEVGNRFRTLLDALDTADPADTPDDHRRRPDQRLADALARLVDIGLDHGALPTAGGISRPHVSVLVDLTTFDTDLTDPDRPDQPVPPDHPAWAQLPGAETAWAGTLSPADRPQDLLRRRRVPDRDRRPVPDPRRRPRDPHLVPRPASCCQRP